MSDEFDALINQNQNRAAEVVNQKIDETEKHKQEIRAVIDDLRKYTQSGYQFTKEDIEIVNNAFFKYKGNEHVSHIPEITHPTYYHIIHNNVQPERIKVGEWVFGHQRLTADDLEKVAILKKDKQLFHKLIDVVEKAKHERFLYENKKETQRNWIIGIAVIGVLVFLISRCFAG
ncbi:hypothetical protein AGMMS49991_02400 [Spirochaetia bacterium]|nr:hypothetical protein AGMMS49991_02400 [Spirochaetia bacterium]